MIQNNKILQPDNTAVRTALWRALHVLVDEQPHIVEDTIGLKLIAPKDDWQQRRDMHANFTKRLRASIVTRARFIEDLIIEESKKGITQYVILGAGLDTFAQRNADVASRLRIFEIDQHDTLTWKQQRLIDTGFGIPENLHFVSVDFEKQSWYEELLNAGFDKNKPAVIACTGVTLYLTKEAITTTLKQIATFAKGSTLAMTFYLPIDLMDEQDKPLQEIALKGAAAAGTPMISFFSPDEVLKMSDSASFKDSIIISTKDMEQLYFADRKDNFLPASGEMFLVAKT